MKAVLISIKPKRCELMASGKITIEVRKTRPKLDTPFKCYIYCTKPQKRLKYVWTKKDYVDYPGNDSLPNDFKVFCKVPDGSSPFCSPPYSSKVIGEFVCSKIMELAPLNHSPEDVEARTCLTREEIVKYLKGKGYSWHITDLVIYDRPKELDSLRYAEETVWRRVQGKSWINKSDMDTMVKRPPQSWCYVEEREGVE